MKRKLIYLLSVMLLLSLVSYGAIRIKGENKQYKGEGLTIVTSFYPMYIAALNIADGIDGVQVMNLTENQTGCVHDYQLTTKDMRTLSGAQVVILNGGEMEEFMESVLDQQEGMQVIDSSAGMKFLTGSTHDHTHEEDGDHQEDSHVHNHSNINGHVWLNVERYMNQIQTITDGLCKIDPLHEGMYHKNEEKYLEKLESLKIELDSLKEITSGAEIIIFHDSFAYLAEELGMEVVHAVNTDGETALSAGEIAEVVEEIKLHDISYLFTEEQYEHTIAERIEAETNATAYVMDSLVTGGIDKNSYLKGMKKNIEILKEAFKVKSK